MYTYVPTSKKELSLRKKQSYAEFARIINWGRCNPVKFAEYMFGIKLMDYQAYVFLETWTKKEVVWLMSRGAGKTALAAAYFMTKLLLIPNYDVYVAATKADQAIDSFTKLENIATNNVPSFKSLTDIFRHELKSSNGNTGFGHDPAGYKFTLFNGSQMKTLSSNAAGSRGKRGSVWYDESGFIDREFISVVDKYTAVNANFETSTTLATKQPTQMPLQHLYTSSASSVDTIFYDNFRNYAKRMIAGDPNYFVCDFDADLILDHSSIDGELITSHLDRAQVEQDLRDDPDSAAREYYNHFRTGVGKNAVVTEDCLVRNSYARLPVFYNDTGKRKFIMCYDPARNYDNSILSIFEVIHDSEKGYHLDLVNVISMVNEDSNKKTPLNYVDQLEIIRKAMIAYNGHGVPEWENIKLYIDAGSGGAPRSGIADQLLFPWTDEKGMEHRGVIDPDDPQYETDRRKHPRNARIVHLLEPKKYKAKIFGALEEMADLDLITFTNYDGRRDYLLLEEDGKEGIYAEHILTPQEKMALTQIELTKTEISYMVRTQTPTSHTVTYELTRERRYRMHDDRAYTLAMGAYALWELRNTDLRSRKVNDREEIMFKARAPKLKIGRR